MRYLTVFSLLLISSCSWIQGFNDWADDLMPRYNDYDGNADVIYRTPEQQYNYQQPANPGYVRPDQPNPVAPGGVFNSPGYQPPYGTYGGHAESYTPPVNNLPPVPGEEPYEPNYWDHSIPPPPIGY